MTRTRSLRYTCAFAVVAMAVLGLDVAADAGARPARTEPVLPSMTPLVVSATGGGSLTPLGHTHQGRATLPLLTPKIVSATGGGSITPLPASAVPVSQADPASSSVLPLVTPVATAVLLVAWMAMIRRRRRRPAVEVTMG
jgi:hypothetical protein